MFSETQASFKVNNFETQLSSTDPFYWMPFSLLSLISKLWGWISTLANWHDLGFLCHEEKLKWKNGNRLEVSLSYGNLSWKVFSSAGMFSLKPRVGWWLRMEMKSLSCYENVLQ